MVIKNVSLETVIGVTSKIPQNTMPEIAFAGKSNVGKSSLINTLMNRKSLARTSAQPGKTQTINFYKINDVLYFVDLPGYGYAKVSQHEKEKWGKMIERYLHQSKVIKAVRQGLGLEKDTIIIPFSAQTKQGRDEIYELIDHIIEQPEEGV